LLGLFLLKRNLEGGLRVLTAVQIFGCGGGFLETGRVETVKVLLLFLRGHFLSLSLLSEFYLLGLALLGSKK